MKLVIKDQEEEPIIRLELQQRDDKVALIASHKNGLFSYLLRFHNSGEVQKCTGIHKEFGFNLEPDGSLKID